MTRLPPLSKRYTEQQIKDALAKNWGTLTYTCIDLDCTIGQFNQYLQKHPEVAEYRQSIREQIIDLAEKAIIHNLEKDNLNAATFALKTLGSNRGWGEQTKIQIELTPEEQKQRIKEIFGISDEETTEQNTEQQ